MSGEAGVGVTLVGYFRDTPTAVLSPREELPSYPLKVPPQSSLSDKGVQSVAASPVKTTRMEGDGVGTSRVSEAKIPIFCGDVETG